MKFLLAWVMSFGIVFSSGLMAFASPAPLMSAEAMQPQLLKQIDTDEDHRQQGAVPHHSEAAACSMACLGVTSEREFYFPPSFSVSQSVPVPSDVLAGLTASPPQRPPRG